ncbi:membrane protein [Bombiscardovia apis]|uniref:Membrane protein n=1 Tax=Bombiscardovia apis TaxID=2932182 RepID=A0ABN6SJ79_9BIFI|nr:MgtC/SapB family protein [Bombiscardovia apis]BDR54715.1 membrane protein [Bombiscardovia apis]
MQGFELPAATQIVALVLTVVLCGLIGFEREYLKHDAGIRTHILVGLGSCLFTLVSIYGVNAAVGNYNWDASRIAAGVASGIGFIGAGVIFFNHDAVRGLTTSSAIWVASAVGVTCGASMFTVAIVAVALYFISILVISPIVKWLLRNRQSTGLRIVYEDGHGSLRATLLEASKMGFESRVLGIREVKREGWHGASVTVNLLGKGDVSGLVEEVGKTDGVEGVEVLGDED